MYMHISKIQNKNREDRRDGFALKCFQQRTWPGTTRTNSRVDSLPCAAAQSNLAVHDRPPGSQKRDPSASLRAGSPPHEFEPIRGDPGSGAPRVVAGSNAVTPRATLAWGRWMQREMQAASMLQR